MAPAVPSLCAVPAGRQLTGAERTCVVTTEETDIDAVEAPLPGGDSLEFSRGVTDLDAVGKDGGSHTDSKVGRRSPARHPHGATSWDGLRHRLSRHQSPATHDGVAPAQNLSSDLCRPALAHGAGGGGRASGGRAACALRLR